MLLCDANCFANPLVLRSFCNFDTARRQYPLFRRGRVFPLPAGLQRRSACHRRGRHPAQRQTGRKRARLRQVDRRHRWLCTSRTCSTPGLRMIRFLAAPAARRELATRLAQALRPLRSGERTAQLLRSCTAGKNPARRVFLIQAHSRRVNRRRRTTSCRQSHERLVFPGFSAEKCWLNGSALSAHAGSVSLRPALCCFATISRR